MEPEIYNLMYELEESHWWYKGLRGLLYYTIGKYLGSKKDISVLDAGCGTGYNLKCMKERYLVSGVDISDLAIDYCRKRGIDSVKRASVSNLPFDGSTFDLVMSFDVLCHKAVGDDTKAIGEMARVLKKGGILALNLPAFRHLMRSHDIKAHNSRRYTAMEITDKLRENDLKVLRVTYHKAFLYPVALLLSLVSRLTRSKESDLGKVNKLLNMVMYGLAKADNAVAVSAGLPFGTSIFCIAKKTKDT